MRSKSVPSDSLGLPAGAGIEELTVRAAGDGMRVACTIGPRPGFSRLVIRFRTDGATPATPTDGRPLLDVPAVAGATFRGYHHPLDRGSVYSYAAFGLDDRGSIQSTVMVCAWPSAG